MLFGDLKVVSVAEVWSGDIPTQKECSRHCLGPNKAIELNPIMGVYFSHRNYSYLRITQ